MVVCNDEAGFEAYLRRAVVIPPCFFFVDIRCVLLMFLIVEFAFSHKTDCTVATSRQAMSK